MRSRLAGRDLAGAGTLPADVARAELIDPALRAAGWSVVDGSRVRREVITLGRLQGADIRDTFISFQKHLYARQAAM